MKNKAFFITFGLALLAFIYTANQPERTKPPTARTAPIRSGVVDYDPTLVTPTVPPAQQAVIDDHVMALTKISERSEGARILLDFFRSTHGKGNRLNDSSFQVVSQWQNNGWGFLIVADETKRIYSGTTSVAAVFTCHGPAIPFLVLQNWETSDLNKGVLFAHELFHAVACMQGEPPSPAMEPLWLLGEHDAYVAVGKLLQEYTNGEWTSLKLASAERRRQVIRKQGAGPFTVVSAQLPEDIIEIKRIFGDQDELTIGTLAMQLDFESNIHNVTESAATVSPPMLPEELEWQLVDTMRIIYTQHGM